MNEIDAINQNKRNVYTQIESLKGNIEDIKDRKDEESKVLVNLLTETRRKLPRPYRRWDKSPPPLTKPPPQRPLGRRRWVVHAHKYYYHRYLLIFVI